MGIVDHFAHSVMMSSTTPSTRYPCSGWKLRLANGSTAIEGLSGSASAGVGACLGVTVVAASIQQNAVDLHRVVNILELVLTKILEGDAEPAETAFRVFLHSARHADAASFCQRL